MIVWFHALSSDKFFIVFLIVDTRLFIGYFRQHDIELIAFVNIRHFFYYN